MKTKAKRKAPAVRTSYAAPVKLQPPADSMLAVIERAARDESVDLEKMQRLLDMKKEFMREEAEKLFNIAMRDCQQEIVPVVCDAENKHTNSRYAKLKAIDDAIRPIYTKCGFSLTYNSETLPNNYVRITCTCAHTGGFSRPYQLEAPLDTTGAKGGANKTSLQGLGSTVSYLRRYLACMIFNVVTTDEDDDDGQTGREDAQTEGQTDEFLERARKQDSAPVVIDNEAPAWDGLHVMVKGKRQVFSGAPVSPIAGADYLSTIMAKRTHKQSRIDMINENLPLVHALIKDGHGSTVSELHALADKGEA